MDLIKRIRKRLRRKKVVTISNNERYVINSDSLDTDSITSNVSAMLKPIWDLSRTRQRDYFEFQIISDSESEDTEDKDEDTKVEVPKDCYVCKICNTQVPITYNKEHQNSNRHKTLKELTNNVLLRVSQNIDIEMDSTQSQPHQDVYYCEICSKIVLNNDKDSHEMSEEHLNSIIHDKLMRDLVNLYISNDLTKFTKENVINLKSDRNLLDKNDSNQFDKNIKDSEAKNSIQNSYSIDLNADSVEDMKLDLKPVTDEVEDPAEIVLKLIRENVIVPSRNSDQDIINIDNNDKSDLEFIIYSSNLILMEAETKQFQYYINTMINDYEIKNIPAITDKYVIFGNTFNQRILVSLYNYHGLVKNDDNMYCHICQKDFTDDESNHTNSDEHMANDAASPLDEYFVRKINETSNYCMVCNAIVSVDSVIHATENDRHNRFLSLCLTKEPMSKIKRYIYCNDCKRSIESGIYLAHVNNSKHKTNVCNSYAYKCRKKANKENKMADVKATEPNPVRAMLLNSIIGDRNEIFLPNTPFIDINNDKLDIVASSPDNFTGHSVTLANNANIIENLFTIKPEVTNTFPLTPNKDTITGKSITVKSEGTNKSLAASNKDTIIGNCSIFKPEVIDTFPLTPNRDTITGKPISVKSEVTNKSLAASNKDTTIGNSSTGKPERTNKPPVASKNGKLVGNSSTVKAKSEVNDNYPNYVINGRTPKEKRCTICKVYIPYTVKNLNEHLKAMNHRNNLLKYESEQTKREDIYKCDVCNININDILKHYQDCHSKDNYCCFCNVKVPLNSELTHNNGAKHKDNLKMLPIKTYDDTIKDYETLMKVGVIELVGKGRLFCNVCDAYIPNFEEDVLQHVNGARHTAFKKQLAVPS